jgi:hypothetical protein
LVKLVASDAVEASACIACDDWFAWFVLLPAFHGHSDRDDLAMLRNFHACLLWHRFEQKLCHRLIRVNLLAQKGQVAGSLINADG